MGINLALSLLNSFSEILFVANPLLGGAVILALAVYLPMGLILSLLSTFVAIGTSLLLNIDKNIINEGAAGYNSALLGLMLAFYFKSFSWYLVPLALIGSVIVTFIFYLLYKNNIFAFAGPYTLIAWSIIFLFKLLR